MPTLHRIPTSQLHTKDATLDLSEAKSENAASSVPQDESGQESGQLKRKRGNVAGSVRGNYKSFSDRIEDLKAYKEKHGNLNVLSTEDQSLATFVSNIRHAKKHPDKASMKLSPERIAELEALGFAWKKPKKGEELVTATAGQDIEGSI